MEQIKFAGIEDIYGNAPVKLKYPINYSYVSGNSYITYRLQPTSSNEYVQGLYNSNNSYGYSAFGPYYLKYHSNKFF